MSSSAVVTVIYTVLCEVQDFDGVGSAKNVFRHTGADEQQLDITHRNNQLSKFTVWMKFATSCKWCKVIGEPLDALKKLSVIATINCVSSIKKAKINLLYFGIERKINDEYYFCTLMRKAHARYVKKILQKVVCVIGGMWSRGIKNSLVMNRSFKKSFTYWHLSTTV